VPPRPRRPRCKNRPDTARPAPRRPWEDDRESPEPGGRGSGGPGPSPPPSARKPRSQTCAGRSPARCPPHTWPPCVPTTCLTFPPAREAAKTNHGAPAGVVEIFTPRLSTKGLTDLRRVPTRRFRGSAPWDETPGLPIPDVTPPGSYRPGPRKPLAPLDPAPRPRRVLRAKGATAMVATDLAAPPLPRGEALQARFPGGDQPRSRARMAVPTLHQQCLPFAAAPPHGQKKARRAFWAARYLPRQPSRPPGRLGAAATSSGVPQASWAPRPGRSSAPLWPPLFSGALGGALRVPCLF